MNKSVFMLLGEIVFLTCIVLFTVYIFVDIKDKNLKTTQGLLTYNSNIEISSKQDSNSKLAMLSDSEAVSSLEEDIIQLENKLDYNTNYELYLQVTKQDNMNNYKVKVNDNIYYLNDIYSYEDDNYIYYELLNNTINSKELQEISFIIWIDDKSSIVSSNSFTYNFLIKENKK